jgi:hypothetical protein
MEHEITWEIDPKTGAKMLVVVETEPFARPDSWPWIEFQPERVSERVS